MKIIIYGEPQGKGRPRFSAKGGAVRTYTPPKTAEYEKMIAAEWIRQTDGYSFGNRYVQVFIEAYFGVPERASKAMKAKIFAGDIFPAKKPDVDNVAKVVLDALNGVAYNDDKQVMVLTVEKRYDNKPRVEVEVEEF